MEDTGLSIDPSTLFASLGIDLPDDSPKGKRSTGASKVRPKALATFEKLYQSNDGKLHLYQTEDGHLQAVDSAKLI